MRSRRSRHLHFPDILMHSDWSKFLFLKISRMWFARLNWMGCRLGGALYLIVCICFSCCVIVVVLMNAILYAVGMHNASVLHFLSAITNLSISLLLNLWTFFKCCHHCCPGLLSPSNAYWCTLRACCMILSCTNVLNVCVVDVRVFFCTITFFLVLQFQN